MEKILQIVPATGEWYARHRQKDGSIELFRVAVWAVAETLDGQRVVGMSETAEYLEADDFTSDFEGYQYGNDKERFLDGAE